MKLFGIVLRKPTFGESTIAAIMATGLWLLALGLMRSAQIPVERADAGALLLVVFWGCMSVRCGIRIEQGRRHLVANLFISGVLLGIYEGAWALGG